MPEDYDTLPPSGIDRADGTADFPGTITPPDSLNTEIGTELSGPGTFFEEDSDSPEFDFGEQGTVAHSFTTDPDTFEMLIPVVQRGIIQQDSAGNLSKILSTTVKRLKGDRVKMVIVSEGLSWGVPPDEFSIEPMDINPDLMKHPRYNDGSNGATGFGLTDQQKAALRFVTNSQNFYNVQDGYNSVIAGAGVNPSGGQLFPLGGPGGTTQRQQAWEIIQKYWRGEDTFYLPALRITYSTFYYDLENVAINPGGYIEDPVTSGAIPYPFWSIDGTDNPDPTNDILQKSAIDQSYNLYNSGVSYLRQCDQLAYQRTWFKVTQCWIGAPKGPQDANGNNYIYWDNDIYQVPPTPLGALPS